MRSTVMTDSFTRPYVDVGGRVVYLTDEQAAKRVGDIRRLSPGEVVTPEVVGETQIAPDPVTSTRQAADTILGDPVAHPVPEVREREVP